MISHRPNQRRGAWQIGGAVAALLAFYLWMALTAAEKKGPAFDEVGHLAAGYNLWLNHDFRLDPANGDLAKRWAAIPLVFSHPKFPPVTDEMWRQGELQVVGFRFLFESGNDAAALLRQSRAMVALLAAVLGWLVFAATRERFGVKGGFLALGLFVFDPNLLAHGALVTSDLTAALAIFASTWLIWRVLHAVTWGRLAGSLAVFGLAVLAKLSAVILLPITGVMLTIRLMGSRPLIWRLGPERVIFSRRIQLVLFSALIGLHGLAGWAAIWADYDFRYEAKAPHQAPGLAFQQQPGVPGAASSAITSAFEWCRKVHLLPEGFLHGAEQVLRNNQGRQAFMDGEWRVGGWPSFFPHAFLWKTPPALLLLLPLGLITWLGRNYLKRQPIDVLYESSPFFVLIMIYGAVAIAQNINIGHRHILPLYPALYVLAGSAAMDWSSRSRWYQAMVGALALGFVVSSWTIRPNYLAYQNELAGGPENGYRHWIDSSLDWGMDLPGLKRWLTRNNPGDRIPVFLAYFGTGSPDYYGIRSLRLPGFFDWRAQGVFQLAPGYYAISATLLESVYTETFGPWNSVYEGAYQRTRNNMLMWDRTAGDDHKRDELLTKFPSSFWAQQYQELEQLQFGRLCAWLRNKRSPDANVGYSILIWKLDRAALQEALEGPPVEMRELPPEAALAPAHL